MAFSRLWLRQGMAREAHAALAPVHNWFTEGLDSADLRQAEALLADPRMGSRPLPGAG
jgi:hypothetical protein